MKLLVLYRPDSEHASRTESFLREFSQRYPDINRIDVLDLNTRDGAATASIYDVMQYPALIAATDDGIAQQVWQGDMLPLMSDVSSYFRI